MAATQGRKTQEGSNAFEQASNKEICGYKTDMLIFGTFDQILRSNLLWLRKRTLQNVYLPHLLGHDVRPGNPQSTSEDIQQRRNGVGPVHSSTLASRVSSPPAQPEQLDDCVILVDEVNVRHTSNGSTSTSIQKDPKSFSQNLFDTNAVKSLHGALPPSSLRVSSPNQIPSTEKSSRTETLLEHRDNYENEQGTVQHTEIKKQPTSPKNNLGASNIDHVETSNEVLDISQPSILRTDHPQPCQTLSHFSTENVKALTSLVCSQDRQSTEEQAGGDLSGLIRPDETESLPLGRKAFQKSSLASFVRQSIVYILSQPSALIDSFRNTRTSGVPDQSNFSVGFHEMVQAFHRLYVVEGREKVIIPSLLVACTSLYASFRPQRKRMDRQAPNQSSEDEKYRHLAPTYSGALQEREAAHIAQIILAALVAYIPPCNIKVWLLARECHNKSLMVPDQEKDPATIRSVLQVLHVFDNETALLLLARLVKALSTRIAVIEMSNKVNVESDDPKQTSQIQRNVVRLFVDVLLQSEPRPNEGLVIGNKGSRVFWVHGPPPTGKSAGFTPTYIEMIIEWLKYLIIKQWDGNMEVDRFEAVGGSLEVLWCFSKYSVASPVSGS
ncbi:MAG: hypothetical protein Q9181_000638 [Wetmoreana brouardii]